ncbi:MAG: protoheme IX farnesyltransferase [Acidimicrobiia bacterium]|nr:heme o synthase [Acidimicrobiia bacterium]NNF64988.1 protoheme IX farnesyltransferase [Acidimicrobiia bacterium]
MSTAAVAAPSSSRLRAYVELTKPRIIELLLVTTVPAMFLAADGWPGGWLIIATLIGGTLSAAGANSINNVVDRDIDQIMQRTSKRPFPTERVTVKPALALGITLGVAGLVWLWLTVNLLAGLLSTAGLLFYVFVYTLYLKRSSTQNIVIGGAAGAVPALVGWAAVTDSLSLPAWILFAIVFFWTPPHFWALSLKYKDDYAAAGVPMLPVVAGEAFTLLHIFLYSVLLVAVTFLLFPAAGMGLIYLITAAVLGIAFVAGAARLRTRPHLAMKFFGYSNLYLVGLSVGIIVDRLVA